MIRKQSTSHKLWYIKWLLTIVVALSASWVLLLDAQEDRPPVSTQQSPHQSSAAGEVRALAVQDDTDYPVDTVFDSRESHNLVKGTPGGSRNELDIDFSGDWSATMESAIWAILQASGRNFSRIELVTCNEPTCDIRFTGADYRQRDQGFGSWGDFGIEIMRKVGTDDEGEQIIKQATYSIQEEYPGTWVMVLRISSEPPNLPDAFTRDELRHDRSPREKQTVASSHTGRRR